MTLAWPRHPVVFAQEVLAIDDLAPVTCGVKPAAPVREPAGAEPFLPVPDKADAEPLLPVPTQADAGPLMPIPTQAASESGPNGGVEPATALFEAEEDFSDEELPALIVSGS